MRLVGGIAVAALAVTTAACSDSSEPPRGVVDLGGPPPTFAIEEPDGGDCSFDYRSQISGIDPSTGEVEWEVDVPWTNENQLVVDGSRIFVNTADYPNDHPSVIAIDGRDGTPLWQHEVEDTTGRPPAPLIVDERLVVLDGTTVAGLDLADGARRWDTSSGGGETLLAANDTSVFATGDAGGLQAIDADRGSARDLVEGDGSDDGSVGVLASDDLVFSGDQTGELYAVDARTGERRWSQPATDGRAWWPLFGVHDDILLVGDNPSGEAPATEPPDRFLRALDATTGQDRWTRLIGDPLEPRFLVDDLVFVPSDDRLVAVDVATGEERWTLLLGLVGHVSRPAPGLVVVVAGDGSDGTTVTAADEETGVVRWSARLPLQSAGPASVVGGVVLVGGGLGTDSDLVDAEADGLVIALDPQTGDEVWQAARRDAAHARPVEVDGSAVVLSADSSIFCD